MHYLAEVPASHQYQNMKMIGWKYISQHGEWMELLYIA